MKKEMIPLPKDKRHIVVEQCSGNLILRPIDEPVLRIRGGDYEIQETKNGYQISSPGDLTIYLFPETTFELTQGLGDVKVKAVNTLINLHEVHGNATITHSLDVTLGHVYGDLVAKHLAGDLIVDSVSGDFLGKHIRAFAINEAHGDIRAKHTAGDVTIGKVLGDVSLFYVSGGVNIADGHHDVTLNRIDGIVQATALGDIRVKNQLPSGKHTLNAKQDVVLLWPPKQPLSISAQVGRVTNRFQFDHVSENENHFEAHLGEGGPHLNIVSEAVLIIKNINQGSINDQEIDIHLDLDFEFGNEFEALGSRMATFGEEIASKISSRMADITSQLEGQFKAMRKKEEAVRRASERVSRYAAPAPPAPPAVPTPPTRTVDPAAVDDAKLKVLQLLENGKISVEEANTLLKALE